MEVNKEFVSRRGLGYSFSHFHCRLVVAVKEIRFPALDAHPGIFLAGFHQMLIQNVKDCPENDAYTFLPAVVNQSL